MDSITPRERGILAGLSDKDYFFENPFDSSTDEHKEWQGGHILGEHLLKMTIKEMSAD